MPFAKNHNCFYSQDQHGELPTREPYPPSPRPDPGCNGYRTPCPQPLTLSAGQWSGEVCKLALNSGLSCLRPGRAQGQSDPWVCMAFRPELGPVSILWVADACSLVLGWTVAFSCNCSMASTHLHDLRLQGINLTHNGHCWWCIWNTHRKQEKWVNKAPLIPPYWKASHAV